MNAKALPSVNWPARIASAVPALDCGCNRMAARRPPQNAGDKRKMVAVVVTIRSLAYPRFHEFQGFQTLGSGTSNHVRLPRGEAARAAGAVAVVLPNSSSLVASCNPRLVNGFSRNAS